MNKLLAAGLIVLDIISFKVLPLSAQNINSESRECKNAIASVENRLQTGRELKIELSLIDDLEFIPGKHPEGRPNLYSFSMSGNAVDSVMVSPVFLNSLATEIINGCNSISVVTFYLNQTDWVEVHGLMPDGKVKPFECPENFEYNDTFDFISDSGIELVWGQYCSL